MARGAVLLLEQEQVVVKGSAVARLTMLVAPQGHIGLLVGLRQAVPESRLNEEWAQPPPSADDAGMEAVVLRRYEVLVLVLTLEPSRLAVGLHHCLRRIGLCWNPYVQRSSNIGPSLKNISR